MLFYEDKGFCPDRGRDIGHLILSAITMGKAYLATPAGLTPEGEKCWVGTFHQGHEKQGRGVKIGWVKDDEILLQPDVAYSVAYKLAQDQGEILPGSVDTIKPDLKEQGALIRTDEKRRKLTVRRTVEGEQQDVLLINYESFQESLWTMPIMPTIPTIPTLTTEPPILALA